MILFTALLLFAPFFLPQFKVIFFPTSKEHIKYLKSFLKFNQNDVVYDLGSGTGQVLAALIRGTEARGIGVELSPLMYLISKLILKRDKNISIIWDDFLNVELTKATVVYCFLNPKTLEKLAPKFEKELSSEAKIISYIYKIKGMETEVIIKDPSFQELFSIYKIKK